MAHNNSGEYDSFMWGVAVALGDLVVGALAAILLMLFVAPWLAAIGAVVVIVVGQFWFPPIAWLWTEIYIGLVAIKGKTRPPGTNNTL